MNSDLKSQSRISRIKQRRSKQHSRVRVHQYAALRVLNGESGASANTATRMATQSGYFEGMDLGRIETNRKRQIQSLQDAKQGEVNNTIYAIQRGEMNARNEMAGAILGSASAAVQIGAQDYKYQRYEFMRAGGSADDFHFDFLGLNSRQPQTNIMWNETRIDQHDIRWN